MKTKVMLVLLVAACVVMVGCSKITCFYGECKALQSESYLAQMASQSAEPAELTAGLQRVRDYYATLDKQTGLFGGLAASAGYSDIINKAVALSDVVAGRAERGELSVEEMQRALSGFAIHLQKLEAGVQGTR